MAIRWINRAAIAFAVVFQWSFSRAFWVTLGTLTITFCSGHAVFLVCYWIIAGFRKE